MIESSYDEMSLDEKQLVFALLGAEAVAPNCGDMCMPMAHDDKENGGKPALMVYKEALKSLK